MRTVREKNSPIALVSSACILTHSTLLGSAPSGYVRLQGTTLPTVSQGFRVRIARQPGSASCSLLQLSNVYATWFMQTFHVIVMFMGCWFFLGLLHGHWTLDFACLNLAYLLCVVFRIFYSCLVCVVFSSSYLWECHLPPRALVSFSFVCYFYPL